MGDSRRRFLRIAASSAGVLLPGCVGGAGPDPPSRRPAPAPDRQGSTDPVRALGEDVETALEFPAVRIRENGSVLNSSSGERTELSEWKSSVVRNPGRRRLETVVADRSNVAESDLVVERESDPDGFLVSVLVDGPPEGVQELTVPEYFDVKRTAPRTVRLNLRASGTTTTVSLSVYVRAELDVTTDAPENGPGA